MLCLPWVLCGQAHQVEQQPEGPSIDAWLAGIADSLQYMDDTVFSQMCFAKAGEFFGSDFDTSNRVYQRMIDLGKEYDRPYLSYRGYNARGEVNRMRRKTAEAIADYKASIQYRDYFEKDMSTAYCMLGQLLGVQGDMDMYKKYIDSATQIAYKYRDTARYVIVHNFRAGYFKRVEQYYSALEEYKLALEFFPNVKGVLPQSDIYLHISDLYSRLEDDGQAIKAARKALSLIDGMGYDKSEAHLLANLAHKYFAADSLELALSTYQQAEAIQKKYKRTNYLTDIYAAKAEIYSRQDKIELARTQLELAQRCAADIQLDFEKASLYSAEATVYAKLGDYRRSTASALRRLRIARSQGHNGHLIASYRRLADNAKATQNYRLASRYQDSMQISSEALDLDRKRNLTLDLLAKYENTKKEAEIAQLSDANAIAEANLRRTRAIQLATWLGLILLTIAALTIFALARQRQKSNQLLSEKNQALEASLATNQTLVKEIHHRVKNNLQIVSSLLNLQSLYEKDHDVIEAINTGKNRIQSMSLLHQNLYSNEDLKSISVRKYLLDLLDNISSSFEADGLTIRINSQIDDIIMQVDQVVSLGLLTNEIVTNSLKHGAGKNKSLQIDYSLKKEHQEVVLCIKDNGPGLPFDTLPLKTQSVGMQLIRSFSKKLKAQVKIDNTQGAKYTLYIPFKS